MHLHDDGGQGHAHGIDRNAANRKRLIITAVLVGGYMVADVVGGLVSNSLALLADAGHMLSDVAALALSLFAMWVARRPPNPRRTYGYYRAEILAALINGGHARRRLDLHLRRGLRAAARAARSAGRHHDGRGRRRTGGEPVGPLDS